MMRKQQRNTGLDLRRKFLQRILHPRPLWSKAARIRAEGEEDHHKHVHLRHDDHHRNQWLLLVMIRYNHYWQIPPALITRLWWSGSTTGWRALVSFTSGRRGLVAMPAFSIRWRAVSSTSFILIMILARGRKLSIEELGSCYLLWISRFIWVSLEISMFMFIF